MSFKARSLYLAEQNAFVKAQPEILEQAPHILLSVLFELGHNKQPPRTQYTKGLF